MLLNEIYKPYGCLICEKINETMYNCAKCKVARYCSKECQSSDWPSHKDTCIIIVNYRELNK